MPHKRLGYEGVCVTKYDTVRQGEEDTGTHYHFTSKIYFFILKVLHTSSAIEKKKHTRSERFLIFIISR